MRGWGAQWNTDAMEYLLDSGSGVSLGRIFAENCTGTCLILGISSEASLVNPFSSDVVRINISREELEHSRENAMLILADAHHLPFKQSSFDTIVSKSVLHHFTDLNGAMTELKQVLRESGFFVLFEPGLLNHIAFFGRKLFPTDIHVDSEQPFVPTSLKKLLVNFKIIEDEYHYLFVHLFPILAKYVVLFRKNSLLHLFYYVDAFLCRTLLRNTCWVLIFLLRKNGSDA
jgi:SAM-dependent methyltransferase